MTDMTQRFVTALRELHQNREVDELVDLFADDATLNKAGIPHGQKGKDGARTFWREYRDVFDEIDATFTHTVTDDDLAYLEWTSRGTLRTVPTSVTTASASWVTERRDRRLPDLLRHRGVPQRRQTEQVTERRR